jgi:hypothetical protein
MLQGQPPRGQRPTRRLTGFLTVSLGLILAQTVGVAPALGQIPEDRIHLSLSLGGYVMLGIGITHWMEEHHSLEATLFPLGFPWEGFPAAVKVGYAWTPSDEVWRAKLGGNVTMLRHSHPGSRGGFTPLLAFTPGLQYDATDSRSLRADLWMSYFLSEGVFAPTALELIHAWK